MLGAFGLIWRKGTTVRNAICHRMDNWFFARIRPKTAFQAILSGVVFEAPVLRGGAKDLKKGREEPGALGSNVFKSAGSKKIQLCFKTSVGERMAPAWTDISLVTPAMDAPFGRDCRGLDVCG
ncbi:hypothetical protein DYI23_01380 [Roseibium polysiphoniae]|uniref:Uncharacterized protein n=1 Tax=Roseibium polysiphoniae TaxID=2571221 RepID=A0A944C6R2_9HYPH|nr:hypothetical protein [Roseibium polysiphoniae]